jgi:flagellar basal body rod protein FlgC
MSDINIPGTGMSSALVQFNIAAGRIAKSPLSVEESSGAVGDVVDLSAEMVAMMAAKNTYDANLKAAESMDFIQKNLLDVLG